ncbi:predicted protein, partial [Nematostella vectensis]
EKWDYVTVRPSAHMFWWLYGARGEPSERENKPLILWLQGGPGGSSTGYGNFMELGPLDVNLKLRNTSWVEVANVLFVDNPVGAGFSYVTDKGAYTTNVTGIAQDLLTMFKAFVNEMPAFQTIPLYIFCESYGGKMTSAFGVTLYNAIQQGEIRCNFKGVALGDSWISPVDSVLSWGPYLYSASLLDQLDLDRVNQYAQATANAVANQEWKKATDLWSETENVIAQTTDNVDVYNILIHNAPDFPKFPSLGRNTLDQLYANHVGRLNTDPLTQLMNGPIKKKLGIIPNDVIWGSQSGELFTYQSEDFMRPVISDVSYLLNKINVVIYQGQLDMICDTNGAENWMKKLKWNGLDDFLNTPRQPLYPPSGLKTKQTGAFRKKYGNLSLYYIMKAGHMVPSDAGEMALEMVKDIIQAN